MLSEKMRECCRKETYCQLNQEIFRQHINGETVKVHRKENSTLNPRNEKMFIDIAVAIRFLHLNR